MSEPVSQLVSESLTTFTSCQFSGYGRVKVTIRVSETFGNPFTCVSRESYSYMEFVINWQYPDVNGDARLASGRSLRTTLRRNNFSVTFL